MRHSWVTTFGKMLEGKGFSVLADSEKLPIPYQGSGLKARRSLKKIRGGAHGP